MGMPCSALNFRKIILATKKKTSWSGERSRGRKTSWKVAAAIQMRTRGLA